MWRADDNDDDMKEKRTSFTIISPLPFNYANLSAFVVVLFIRCYTIKV